MPIFYISSFGGSGTKWISNVLTSHPSLICFHGTRSLPPYTTTDTAGTNEMTPELFSKGLSICMKNVENAIHFGAIHGYYGSLLHDAIKKEGGTFSSVIRNPIKRINSLFNHHYKQFIEGTGEEHWDKSISVYDDIKKKKLDVAIIKNDNYHFSRAAQSFATLCNDTIMYDVELLDKIGNDLNFKMEDLISDRDYFAHFVETITDNQVEINSSYLEKVTNFGAVNQHANSSEDVYTIYNKWPNLFRLIYQQAILRFGDPNVLEVYKDVGYDIVDNLSETICVQSLKSL